MKEKIIMITLLISILLIIGLAIFGIKIGGFQILSISQLVDKNKDVNQKIDDVSTITTIEYPDAVSKLESTTSSLKVQKEKYEELAGFSEGEEEVYTTEKFDIEYLWTIIGKYASKNNIGLIMDIKKSSGTGLYDLYFTIKGEYVDISQFVATLENDSELSFRIYNFKLTPGSSDVNLKATFTVKDININDDNLIKNSASTTDNTTTSLTSK